MDELQLAAHVAKQEEINSRLTDAISSIAGTTAIMAKDIKGINESMHKQETILSEVRNLKLDVESKNSIAHKRIDETKVDYKERFDAVQKDQINPIKGSLKWVWAFICTSLLSVVIALMK